MRRRLARLSGFTLVELLVVIGIIALLIAVLMPALATARSQANRLRCATNVRTLAQVALQYAHDNKGWVPRNYAHNEPPFPSWVDLLVRSMKRNLPAAPVGGAYTQAYDTAAMPFYAATQWLQCPVFPDDAQPVDYVINGWGKDTPSGGRSPLLKITSIRRSGEIAFFLDGNQNRPTGNFMRHDVWQLSHLPKGSDARVLDDQRHRGVLNVACVDGHVDARPFKDLRATDFTISR
jgi:prepilin-type N-terminal cleavage/methylation domain-containing protein